jgi:hypothetical protein
MMTPVDHLKGIFSISGGLWALFYLYSNYSIKNFIVKRYKHETGLAETAFFKDHVPFVLFLPDFFSAGFFATHLLMCVWGWRLFGKKKVFKDIDDPEDIIRHFSKKEIRHVKWVLISGFIFFSHGIAYVIFHYIWPEVFS